MFPFNADAAASVVLQDPNYRTDPATYVPQPSGGLIGYGPTFGSLIPLDVRNSAADDYVGLYQVNTNKNWVVQFVSPPPGGSGSAKDTDYSWTTVEVSGTFVEGVQKVLINRSDCTYVLGTSYQWTRAGLTPNYTLVAGNSYTVETTYKRATKLMVCGSSGNLRGWSDGLGGITMGQMLSNEDLIGPPLTAIKRLSTGNSAFNFVLEGVHPNTDDTWKDMTIINGGTINVPLTVTRASCTYSTTTFPGHSSWGKSEAALWVLLSAYYIDLHDFPADYG